MEKNKKIKYFLYARKSTESEDRQVASINAQIEELSMVAEREGLRLIKTFSESKSAKAPGRPIFNEMISRINDDEAQGILCWKLDRLARNPIDGGNISWMLQQGVIEHIRTHDKSYYPADNVLMMSIELGMANQFIRDLRDNTKRGLLSKARNGWFPGMAPIGYTNSPHYKKGEKEIFPDPERFSLVRKMWDLLLEKNHSPEKIWQIARNDWKLTTGQRSKSPISRAHVYRIFQNPFYQGSFIYSGQLYEGKHKPMVTKNEWEAAQIILGNKSSPRLKTHSFVFGSGLIRCGECGSAIVAYERIKRQKNGNVHRYIYHRCGKSKNNKCCQQKGDMREEELVRQATKLLDSIEIPAEFCSWALSVLRERHSQESEDRNTIIASQQKEYDRVVSKLDMLIDMRISQEINEKEFSQRKQSLSEEKERLEELLSDTDGRINQWIERAEEAFNFAEKAKQRFTEGDTEMRRAILIALGSSFTLQDKILSIEMKEPFVAVQTAAKETKKIHEELEPLTNNDITIDFGQKYAENPILGGRGDSNSP